MKAFKSDGRYNHHKRGFTYIVEFRWSNLEDTKLWSRLTKTFAEIHGPHIERYFDASGWPRSRYNEHYILEQKRGAKRRRIYIKDEATLTLALLKAGND